MPEVRRHGSGRGSGAAPAPATSAANSCWAHSHLPALLQLGGQQVAQLEQQLDIQGCVGQPLRGQRPGRPVRRRVLLQQPDAEQLLEHRAERDPGIAEQPAGELGVEQDPRHQSRPRTGRCRSWLAAWITHSASTMAAPSALRSAGSRSFGAVSVPGGTPPSPRGEGDRVDQVGAGAGAAQLDQVGPLAVAEAVGPLGIDRDRPGAGGQPGDGLRPAARGRLTTAGTPSAGSVSRSAS